MRFTYKVVGSVALATMAGTSLVFVGTGATISTAAVLPFAHVGGAPAIAAPAPSGVYAPATAGTSKAYFYNWSGYAQTGLAGTFKAVEDTWTVPTVNTSVSGQQFSSDWVGIGGYNESTLVQDGTEADNINGTAHYDAWTEILPADEVVLTGLTIRPGNQIKSTVVETSTNTWTMTVDDLTTGHSGSRTVSYDSSGESAEAVHERPEVGGSLSNLAQTTNLTFTPGESSVSKVGTTSYKPLLKATKGGMLEQMFMVNSADTAVIASPSVAASDKEGFSVADGSTSPPAP